MRINPGLSKHPHRYNSRPPEYDGEAARTAREWLISQVAAPPRRVLTAPGNEGYCARLFRSVWPDAEMIGIDHVESIVASSALADPGRPLDQYYHADLYVLANARRPGVKFVLPGNRYNETNVIRRIGSDPFDYGRFDLAFLDFGCSLRSTALKHLPDFVAARMNPGGLVALTVVAKPSEDVTASILKMGLTVREVYRYQTRTPMAIITIEAAE